MKKSRLTAAANQTKEPGVIRDGETYTLAELERRSGLGRFAMRQLRRRGLVVRRISGRAFILGADFNRFLLEATTPKAG